MKPKVTVSVAQMKVLSAQRNLPKILHYIRKAARHGADIICLPEGSFNLNHRKPSLESDLLRVKEKCKKENIFAIINGYFEAKSGDVRNRTYLIGNRGKILGFYDKIHLWTTEVNKVKRGNLVKVINTSLGKIGLCTCWDLFFPKMFEKLKNKGAEIIFCPSYWKDEFIGKESSFLEYAPTVMAYQNMCFFVYCNARLRGTTSVSKIAAPWGELATIKSKERMITAKLYCQRLKRFRNHFKTVFWERNELKTG